MTKINQTAYAKINLCLHVVGQRSDGYHLLDSLVAFATIGDEISAAVADGFSLKIDGPYAGDVPYNDNNLMLRAARLFSDKCSGAALSLTKNLPVSSGIGGGSADAAATLRAMAQICESEIPADAGLSLGADVPVCVKSQTCRMQGIGSDLTPMRWAEDFHAVLANPHVGVSTQTIFQGLAAKTNPPITDKHKHMSDLDYLATLRNDLQSVAIQHAPVIGTVLAALETSGAALVRMSGSGATCFGLYETRDTAQAAARDLAVQYPEWWVKSCLIKA